VNQKKDVKISEASNYVLKYRDVSPCPCGIVLEKSLFSLIFI